MLARILQAFFFKFRTCLLDEVLQGYEKTPSRIISLNLSFEYYDILIILNIIII